jgi:hypothetical protein
MKLTINRCFSPKLQKTMDIGSPKTSLPLINQKKKSLLKVPQQSFVWVSPEFREFDLILFILAEKPSSRTQENHKS